jgi:hypothetical protein
MEPRKITAPEIRVGDRIRLTTADHVTHELVVGRIGHRDYVIRPVQSRNTATLIELAPSDTVELLDRPATARTLDTANVSVLSRGDTIGGHTIATGLAFVLGEPDSGFVVVGGSREELRRWLGQLQLHLGSDGNGS